jgi:hypothetical protein
MHIIISGAAIFATNSIYPVIIFLSIKTVVDVGLHILEHSLGRIPITITTTK